MGKKCKYCGKEIEGVLPAPLTCWTCYKDRKIDSEVISNHDNIGVNITTVGSITKECEMCKRILSIDQFYKSQNKPINICKECITEKNAIRLLEFLNVSHIRKMSASGITAAYLAKETGRVREGFQSMLNALVKTNRAQKKVVKGETKFYLDPELADELIEQKKGGKLVQTPISSISKESKKVQLSGKGICIENVPILKLGPLIEEIRNTTDPNFSLNISTKGDDASIFLSDEQVLNWAKKAISHIVTDFLEDK